MNGPVDPKAPLVESLIDDLHKSMREAIPEIIEAIRRREKLAAELRRGARINA